MQSLLALFVGGSIGLLVWAIVLLKRNQHLKHRLKPILDAESEAERIRLHSLELQASLQEQQQNLKEEIIQLEQEIQLRHADLATVKQELDQATENAELLDLGYYEPKYNFEGLDYYEQALQQIRDRQKALLQLDGTSVKQAAAYSTRQLTYNNSVSQGNEIVRRVMKLMLRAFNGETDSFIARVNYRNITTMEKRIRTSYDQINRIAEKWHCHLNENYLSLRLKELDLVYEYEERKQREKEEQAQIREQMREEERALREYERQQRQAEKDESKYIELLNKARSEVERASESEKNKLAEKIAKLEAQLKEAEDKKQRAISLAQMTRSGYIYVISNIGSFGENIYKIGMTRREDPMDRVKELSNASVPFPFDVHAIIFTEDAPTMENKLHKTFEARRVNMENNRKEFFRVSIEEIRDELTNIAQEEGLRSELRVTLVAEAKQYYLSEAKRKHLEQSR